MQLNKTQPNDADRIENLLDEESKLSEQHQIADLVVKKSPDEKNDEAMGSAQEDEDGSQSFDDDDYTSEEEDSANEDSEVVEDKGDDGELGRLLHMTEAPRKLETVAQMTTLTHAVIDDDESDNPHLCHEDLSHIHEDSKQDADCDLKEFD